MTEFFVYYTLANVVCFIIFGILLLHDLFGIDRRETQIKFDNALIAFMLYFAADCLWAAATAGVIKPTLPIMIFVHFSIYVLMSAITYTWLRYVMAVEEAPRREKTINKFAILFPFLVSTVIMIIVFATAPGKLIDENLETKTAYNVFLVVVPYIYIIAVIIYTIGKVRHEKNPIERRRHIYIGFFPLMLVGSGLVQMIWHPNVPFYCFAATILMLIIYIQSMDTLISRDPLTRLNNRGQLIRYVSQNSNMIREGIDTYVMMIDANRFKNINDTYGHAEGDRALKLIADSLKRAVDNCDMPLFLARYGGDEFTLIAHTGDEKEISALSKDIKEELKETCKAESTPYDISISIGYDKLNGKDDTFQKCMQRADRDLYENKAIDKTARSM